MSDTNAARKGNGKRKSKLEQSPQEPIYARQIGYYDPLREDMTPIIVGRPFNMGFEDDEALQAALTHFNEMFAADPRCKCVAAIFVVQYETASKLESLRRPRVRR